MQAKLNEKKRNKQKSVLPMANRVAYHPLYEIVLIKNGVNNNKILINNM